MNKDEMQDLREGSVIYVPYIVDYVDEEKDLVMAFLPRERREHEEKRRAILPVHTFSSQDIQSWEAPTRRKFKRWDIVLCEGGPDIVVEDEYENGEVELNGYDNPVFATDLTLLLDSEEVEKLVNEKREDESDVG